MNYVAPIFVFGAALASGCQSAPMRPGQCATFSQNLATRDPIAEAEQVARSGTPYLLGVQGYSVSFPGLDDPQAALRFGHRTLEGTSDAILDESCRAFQAEASRFAERYNRRLMSMLDGKLTVRD